MNNVEVTKGTVLSSLFWKLMERGGARGIQFIVIIVIARLLLPEEFGLIVLVTTFIQIADVLVQSGFQTALIQKKDADEVDFSSVFYLNLLIAGLIYFLLFLTAPLLAAFFAEPQLTMVLRVLSLTLFIGVFYSIQNAVIARGMQFKKLFFSSSGAVIVSGMVGIAMAYTGFGVWALVGQQVTNQLAAIIILWGIVKWRPRLLFSIERVKGLYSFGWKLMVASLMDTLYANLRSLIVGKMFSPGMLGFYNRGEQFPGLIVNNIDGAIQSVMLPALSSHQDDRQKVKDMMRRSIVTSYFIIFPMMAGLAAIAEPLIKLILTEKWLPAVPFLQIYCAVYALWPIHTANLQAINALGRSDIFLKLEVVKKIIGLIILGVSIPLGIYAIAMGEIISGLLSTFVNSYPNAKLLNYSFQEQWKDILPSLLLSLVMGASVYSIQRFGMTTELTLIIQIAAGISLYIGLAKMFKLECFTYFLSTGKEIFRKKKIEVSPTVQKRNI